MARGGKGAHSKCRTKTDQEAGPYQKSEKSSEFKSSKEREQHLRTNEHINRLRSCLESRGTTHYEGTDEDRRAPSKSICDIALGTVSNHAHRTLDMILTER